jgi:hypothetical protein
MIAIADLRGISLHNQLLRRMFGRPRVAGSVRPTPIRCGAAAPRLDQPSSERCAAGAVYIGTEPITGRQRFLSQTIAIAPTAFDPSRLGAPRQTAEELDHPPARPEFTRTGLLVGDVDGRSAVNAAMPAGATAGGALVRAGVELIWSAARRGGLDCWCRSCWWSSGCHLSRSDRRRSVHCQQNRPSQLDRPAGGPGVQAAALRPAGIRRRVPMRSTGADVKATGSTWSTSVPAHTSCLRTHRSPSPPRSGPG